MQRIVGQYVDDDGNEYVVLDDPDDDLRNATTRDHRSNTSSASASHSAPRPRGRLVQVNSAPPKPRATSTMVQGTPVLLQPQNTLTLKTDKVLKFAEIFADGVAEFIPLPEMPPAPTGDHGIDHQNQNEHRQALHAHRVLTSRIRTGGRVLSNVVRLLME